MPPGPNGANGAYAPARRTVGTTCARAVAAVRPTSAANRNARVTQLRWTSVAIYHVSHCTLCCLFVCWLLNVPATG